MQTHHQYEDVTAKLEYSSLTDVWNSATLRSMQSRDTTLPLVPIQLSTESRLNVKNIQCFRLPYPKESEAVHSPN